MAQWQPSIFTPDKAADQRRTAASLSAKAISQSLNRTFLSSLFEQIFNSRSEALSLYNAINGTNYTDPALLRITTLSGALFLGYQNDVSFLVGATLNLYEHQSTFNPNMPVRGLIYFSRLYEDYILDNGLDLYSSTQLLLPRAQFFVFYNGTSEQPDRQVLKLSNSFPDDHLENHLEVCAVMLNINYGHNKALMEKCQTLHDYALFVDTVRQYISSGYTRERAVEKSVEECICNNVLKDFLIRNKAEVLSMLFSEYAWEIHLKNLQEEGWKKGLEEGQRLTRIEDILDLLSEIGTIPDSLHQQITTETNLDTLRQWTKNAARCHSIEEFIDKM